MPQILSWIQNDLDPQTEEHQKDTFFYTGAALLVLCFLTDNLIQVFLSNLFEWFWQITKHTDVAAI